MLGHISFGVADLARSGAFYDAVIAALGAERVWTSAKAIGYGPAGEGDKLALFERPRPVTPPGPGFHLAFDAPSRRAVDAFHAAALANDGVDLGAPGLRPHYGAHYYAAFVADPDGYKLEAVYQATGQLTGVTMNRQGFSGPQIWSNSSSATKPTAR